MSDSEDSFESADEGESHAKKELNKKQEIKHVSEKSESQTEETSSEECKSEEKESECGVNNEPKATSERPMEQAGESPQQTNESDPNISKNDHSETVAYSDAMKSDKDDKAEGKTVDGINTGEKGADSTDVASGDTEEQKSDILSGNEHTSDTEKNPGAKSVLDRLAGSEENKSGWGWGGWGSSLLQTASQSVNTFTHSVGDGFSTVLETVESTLGAPDPSELASQHTNEEAPAETKDEKTEEPVDPEKGPGDQDITRETGPSEETETVPDVNTEGAAAADSGGGSSGWFAGFGVSSLTGVVKQTVQQTSTLVQEKSKGIVHGSLDVLESLGKKTYDVLAEGDHGLKKTIEKAKEKPNLSVLLREAKEEAAESAKREEEFVESRKSHFGAQFDEFQGLVQLEALEMLSNQCEAKLHSLLTAMSVEQVATVKQELVSIKEAFELGDMDDDDDDTDHNFTELVTEFTGNLGLNLTAEKLIQVHEKVHNKVRERIAETPPEDKADEASPIKAIHQIAIQSLAELTARTVGHFHRIGQLLLIDPKGPVSAYKTKAAAIASLTKCVCYEVGILSSKSTQALTTAAESSNESDNVNPLITSVYLEATNSSTYLQDAMQLLLPVVQQAAVESTEV